MYNDIIHLNKAGNHTLATLVAKKVCNAKLLAPN
jgi:hypothetical protein